MIARFGLRLRTHPYVGLANNRGFAMFWSAQAISLVGDRVNQIALAVLVYGLSNSAFLSGLVVAAGLLPNLVFGPFAGVLVDRLDRKAVLIGSDLFRGVLVLAIPAAAILIAPAASIPIVFLMTTASVLARTGKVAVVPALVADEALMAANSATGVADTLADLIGLPVAGLIVALLAHQLWLAFVLDAISYFASAALMLRLPIAGRIVIETSEGSSPRRFLDELRAGWIFLRGDAPLFENALISSVIQLSIGINLALLVVYSRDVLDGHLFSYPANLAVLETALGLGALVGGVVASSLGRFRRGPTMLVGFLISGVAIMALGLTSSTAAALVCNAVIGFANLICIVPGQTLYFERTPRELLGRVVALRGTMVFGSIGLASVIGGAAAEFLPAGQVIAIGGGVAIAATLFGFTRRAMRAV